VGPLGKRVGFCVGPVGFKVLENDFGFELGNFDFDGLEVFPFIPPINELSLEVGISLEVKLEK
jgi:hypothetical protein